jgi:uncharacterized membrane protein
MIYFNLMALSFIIWQMSSTIIYSCPELKWIWLKEILLQPLRCWKCIAFWVSLIITGDIYFASYVSIGAYIIECKKYEYIWKRLEKWLDYGMKRKS